jgi:phosphoglucomutase
MNAPLDDPAFSPDGGAADLLPEALLLDVDALIAAYHDDRPDPSVASQRVAFGTSGHRGCALDRSFNEWHVLAITQAVCDHRRAAGVRGPLFLGIDTHAISRPACVTVLEVLAANGVDVVLASGDAYTPTPVVSQAIVAHNRALADAGGAGRADGIVLTPSHNPPRDGGFKYDPPHGGPAGAAETDAIGAAANAYLGARLTGVRRMTIAKALLCATTHRRDLRAAYVAGLGDVVDFGAIRDARLHLGVDPMGGAGVHYWDVIAERYGLDLTVVNPAVDPTFRFVPPDADGLIRMDPASPRAMRRLVAAKDRFDVAFACDTDHDRHGIVTPSAGLMAPNRYLAVAVDHLLRHRPGWPAGGAIGRSCVTTALVDRVAAKSGRRVFETPVGFKWFADGLLDGHLVFAGEESAGATFARLDGMAWTTDKDGIAAALLAAEITARAGVDPGLAGEALCRALGTPSMCTVSPSATPAQKARLASLGASDLASAEVAGEAIVGVLTTAPGNGAPIGGVKVVTANAWFAARPSGTENLYRIYAESFLGEAHLKRVLDEARAIVGRALGA